MAAASQTMIMEFEIQVNPEPSVNGDSGYKGS